MSNKYWIRRSANELQALYDVIDYELEERLAEQYKKTFKKILTQLENVYQTILLENSQGGTRVERLYRYNRYYNTLNLLNEELVKLGNKEIKFLTKALTDMYKKSTGIVGNAFQKSIVLNEETVKRAITNIWLADGKNWSDRIWISKQRLRDKLEEGLVDSLINGTSVDKFTKQMMQDMSTTYNNASCLVKTELAHVQNEATMDSYRAIGIERVKVIDARDSKVCPECKSIHNIPYPIEDAPVLPKHPRCRCCYIAVIE